MKGPLPSLEIIVDPPAASPTAAVTHSPVTDRREPADPRRSGGRPPLAHRRSRAPRRCSARSSSSASAPCCSAAAATPTPAGLDKNAVDAFVDTKLTKTLQDLQRTPAVSADVYRTILPSIVVIRLHRATTAADANAGATSPASAPASSSTTTARSSPRTTSSTAPLRQRVTFADGTEATATDRVGRPDERHRRAARRAPARGDRARGARRRRARRRRGVRRRQPARARRLVERRVWSPASTARIPRRDEGRRSTGSSSSTPRSTRATRAGRCSTATARSSASSPRSPTRPRTGTFIGIGFAVPIGTAGGAAGAPPS